VRSGKVAWRIVLESFNTPCIQRFGSVQGAGSPKSRRSEVKSKSLVSRRIHGKQIREFQEINVEFFRSESGGTKNPEAKLPESIMKSLRRTCIIRSWESTLEKRVIDK
jgi:hypothetical protein